MSEHIVKSANMLKVCNKQGALKRANTDMAFAIADFKPILVYEEY